MDALFRPAAAALGATVDQLKLIACLLIAYPLGSIYVRLPQPALKHLYSIAVTFFFLVPVLNLYSGFLQLLADVLVTWAVARAGLGGSRMPWLVFTLIMGHLTVNHVLRAFDPASDAMDITGPQMVLTMKLTTFAWNVWDGRRPAEDLDKWQLAKRVSTFPSLLEFLGFAFYFPGMLVGPYLDFAEYTALIDGSLYGAAAAAGKTKKGSAIPLGRKRVAYRKLFMGLVYLGLYVVFAGTHNFGVVLTPWFVQQSLLRRIAYFQVCGILERSKYYAVWTLTEGASIFTGLGFTGFDAAGASLWDGAANVRVAEIELPSNFKVLLDSWNMKTNVWLRECVYKRVTPKGTKPGFRSSMITFATSAFWHGIAGGYYLTFTFGAFITTAARLARTTLRPLALARPGAKPLYDLAGTAASVLLVNYVALPFIVLGARDSLRAWARLAWYGHALVFGALAFFYAGGRAWLLARQRREGLAVRAAAPVGGAATPNSAPGAFAAPPLDGALPPPEKL